MLKTFSSLCAYIFISYKKFVGNAKLSVAHFLILCLTKILEY